MGKKIIGEPLSLAAECAIPKIEADLQRRLVFGGMRGAASLIAARPLRTFAASPDRTIVDGFEATRRASNSAFQNVQCGGLYAEENWRAGRTYERRPE